MKNDYIPQTHAEAQVPGVGSSELLGVLPFRRYEKGREYLDVLVQETPKFWRVTCNCLTQKYSRAKIPDRQVAALICAADAFTDYLDRENNMVSCSEVRLESETPWEYVASVPESSPNKADEQRARTEKQNDD